MLKHWVNRSTMEIRSIALKKCDSLPAPRHSQLALPLVLVAHIAIFASNSGVVELYVGNVQHSKAAMWANSTRDGASSEALTYSNCRVNWRHVGVILSQSWGKADNVTYPINWAGSTFGMSNAFSIFQKFLCSISLGPQETQRNDVDLPKRSSVAASMGRAHWGFSRHWWQFSKMFISVPHFFGRKDF